ncbi:MAG: chalcone isomerase family protein, partial [Burkholderiales bacterium]
GLRKRVIVNVYVGALYLTEKKSNGNDVVNAPGAKRVFLHMLRDLTGQQFVDAMKESVKYNTPQADLDKMGGDLTEFYAQLGSISEMKAGTAVWVDLLPGTGLVISAGGKPIGKAISNADLYKAVLRIYVGDKPVDEGLKKGMLGA